MASALATLAQVKEYIGNSADNTDDALLTRLLDYSCELIERACNRVFALTAYTETRDGNGQNFMVFANRPITSVTSVTVNGTAVPQSTGPLVSGWVVGGLWKISLRGQYVFTEGVQNCTIAYSAGFAQMPADLTQAACLMTGLMYKERDRMGIDSKGIGGETINFTKDDFPPSVQRTIDTYHNYLLP